MSSIIVTIVVKLLGVCCILYALFIVYVDLAKSMRILKNVPTDTYSMQELTLTGWKWCGWSRTPVHPRKKYVKSPVFVLSEEDAERWLSNWREWYQGGSRDE